jgi:radical SAM protein with 4Fe4S-binding SPASM domain
MARGLLTKMLQAVNVLFTHRVTIQCDRIPYRFCNVSTKKILNWILAESSASLKLDKPWGMPTHLQVEPSTHCNLKCAFCPVTTGLDRSTGHMSLETFEKAIDELGHCLFLILFWDWGEPFLNPYAYDMIAYAKRQNIKVVSSTNGHMFSQSDHAERLVRSGIDSIIFAVDGISQESYQQFRHKGDLSTVISGIQRVVSAKRLLNSPVPLINLRWLAMKHNEHEIPQLKEFAHSLGVDALTIKTLNPYDQGECHSAEASGSAFVPTDSRFQRFELGPDGRRVRLDRNPCKRPWNNPVLHWDGKISPCTFDPHDRYALGDLASSSFRALWFGKKYALFRRQFRRDYRKIGLCNDCTNAFKGGNIENETIADTHFLRAAD